MPDSLSALLVCYYTSFAGNESSAEFSMLHKDSSYMSNALLAMPPCQSNGNFLEAYEVVLILDDREKIGFVTSYSLYDCILLSLRNSISLYRVVVVSDH
jgi:hypothetical protein